MKGKLNPDAGQASAAETPESLPTAQLAEHRLDHALATTIAFTVLVLAQLGSQGVFRRINGIALDFAPRRTACALRLERAVGTAHRAVFGVGR